MFIIKNHNIDRQKAAVGEWLFMAQSGLWRLIFVWQLNEDIKVKVKDNGSGILEDQQQQNCNALLRHQTESMGMLKIKAPIYSMQ